MGWEGVLVLRGYRGLFGKAVYLWLGKDGRPKSSIGISGETCVG